MFRTLAGSDWIKTAQVSVSRLRVTRSPLRFKRYRPRRSRAPVIIPLAILDPRVIPDPGDEFLRTSRMMTIRHTCDFISPEFRQTISIVENQSPVALSI